MFHIFLLFTKNGCVIFSESPTDHQTKMQEYKLENKDTKGSRDLGLMLGLTTDNLDTVILTLEMNLGFHVDFDSTCVETDIVFAKI